GGSNPGDGGHERFCDRRVRSVELDLMQMNRLVAEALLRVRNGEDLAPFRAWLKSKSFTADGDCKKLSGEMLLRAQGRAQVLDEILNSIEEAPALYEKVKNLK